MVSVCILSYNHERFIAQCLRSVLDQEFEGELEVLVGDDGSSDRTRAIVEELADASLGVVRPFFNEVNLGGSGNLKNLVAHANGRYIAHLDGDDYWLAGKLHEQVQRIEASANCVAVYANAIVMGDQDAELGLFNSNVPDSFGMDYLLERGNFIHHGSLLYRAAERDVVLGIDGEFVDYRVHLRLASRGSLSYIDRPLSAYRWRTSTSIIRTMSSVVHLGYWQALCEAEDLGAHPAQVDRAAGLFWQKLFSDSAMNLSWRYISVWWRRLVGQRPALSATRLVLLALVSPIPAIRRWWRRERTRPAIFFPR